MDQYNKIDEFKIIAVMNEAMINVLKDKGSNYEANLKIQKFLEDETIFFKIDKLQAFEILKKVGVMQDKLEHVYEKLISPNVFYDLLNSGKINIDDNNLIIKYDTYDSESLFKKRK